MTTLLPAGLDPWGGAALIVLSMLTSALTGALGIGGGVALLAALTFVIPVEALIPVHGVIQLGSNIGRTAVLARSAELRLLGPFALGALVGVLIGAAVVTDLPDGAILFAIGLFVCLSPWVKLPPLGRGESPVMAAGGIGATILTMFIGATGPFVVALLRQAGLAHRQLVATTAAAMSVQHALKVSAFAVLGFAFAAWVPLMAAMIATGFVGTLVGTRLIDRLPEAGLRLALKIVLTVIGVQLLVRALW